jgi:hypothetical protein
LTRGEARFDQIDAQLAAFPSIMAKRAGVKVVELDASHAVAVSQPERVAEVIMHAVQGTSSA